MKALNIRIVRSLHNRLDGSWVWSLKWEDGGFTPRARPIECNNQGRPLFKDVLAAAYDLDLSIDDIAAVRVDE